MDIRISTEYDKVEGVPLGSLSGGDVFIFATDTLSNALKCDAVYKVVTGGREENVAVINEKDGAILHRDKIHRVIKLNAILVIKS